MIDIYLGLALAGGLSTAAFYGAWCISQRAPSRTCDLFATALVLGLMVFIRDFWNSGALVKVLPFSNLIVVGNWMVPAVAVLGGLAWRRIPGRSARKGILIGTMMCVAGYSLVHPLRGSVPHCDNRWRNEVCLQSTNASCSPASAATLLRWYQIPATEQEMAELCLTREEGTYWQGLYRGLKLKTMGTDWDVEVFTSKSSADLQDMVCEGPVILTVGIPKEGYVNPTYEADYGWVPGVSHSVVLFEFLPRQFVRIGDPSVIEGQEKWTRRDLDVLWQGHGIRLVHRSRFHESTAARKRRSQTVSSETRPSLDILARF